MNIEHKIIRRNRINGYLFLLPNLIGFLAFMLIPVLFSFGISFTNWDGFGDMKFIGLKNYIDLFSDETFRISLFNTVYFTLLSVPVTMVLALIVAIMLNKKLKGIKFFRAAFFMPYVTATIAVSAVWQLLYHPTRGPINAFLSNLGIANPPGWLSSSEWALEGIIIMTIWKMIGYYMVLFLAGLQGIPKYMYEAADIDGATKFQQFKSVTLPMLSPTIFFNVIIGIINSFKVFDQVYSMTQGGPGRSTNVLVYTIFNEAFVKYKFGYASAMAFVLFLLILIITIIQFKGQEKYAN